MLERVVKILSIIQWIAIACFFASFAFIESSKPLLTSSFGCVVSALMIIILISDMIKHKGVLKGELSASLGNPIYSVILIAIVFQAYLASPEWNLLGVFGIAFSVLDIVIWGLKRLKSE